MNALFDEVAANYDIDFSNSRIGSIQRKRVWKYLSAHFSNSSKKILELNCGTGMDAIWLAKAGHQILATDISAKMLKICNDKVEKSQLQSRITTGILDLKNPVLTDEKSFDFIFSNFGGLNCLNKQGLSSLSSFIVNHLKNHGDCVFILMPKNTFLDQWYRLLQGSYSKYSQRSNDEGLMVAIGDQKVRTYYHNPEDILKCFPQFQMIGLKSIGLVPSYFNKSRFHAFWSRVEQNIGLPNTAIKRSDHYLIHLRKK